MFLLLRVTVDSIRRMDLGRASVEAGKLVRHRQGAAVWMSNNVGLVEGGNGRNGEKGSHCEYTLLADLTGLTFRLDRGHEKYKTNKQINQG